jgi:hypothetical protein
MIKTRFGSDPNEYGIQANFCVKINNIIQNGTSHRDGHFRYSRYSGNNYYIGLYNNYGIGISD